MNLSGIINNIKSAGGSLRGIASSALKMTNPMMHGANPLKFQLPMIGFIAGSSILFGEGTKSDKLKAAAANIGTFALVGGFSNPVRAAMWQGGLALAQASPGMITGMIQGHRAHMNAAGLLAIPFSHSTLAMDQALAAFQYGASRMSDMTSSGMNSQAAMFSARYLNKG